MFEKRIMTVVIGLGGRCFRLFMLFWDGNDWVKYLYYGYRAISS